MSNETANKIPTPKVQAIFRAMLMSDLHLELDETIVPDFPVVAPILILAGDIGRPDIPSLQTFLLAQCQRFEHIFYVAGNHEFYEGEYETRLEQLRALDNLDPCIHFLQNRSYLLPNRVRILGTTLWSHISPQNASRIEQSFADYRYISTVSETNVKDSTKKTLCPITVEKVNKWHAQQHTWLQQEIQKAREKHEHIVVITHHAPSLNIPCIINVTRNACEDAFLNDHEADCVDPVRLWMYGHTHHSFNLMINSTRIVSNQYGYLGGHDGFQPNMNITLYDDGNVTLADSVSSDSGT